MLLLKTIDRTYFTQIIYLMSLKFLCNTCVVHIPPCDPDKRRKSWEIRVYQKYSKSGLWIILGRPPPPQHFLVGATQQSSPMCLLSLTGSPCYKSILISASDALLWSHWDQPSLLTFLWPWRCRLRSLQLKLAHLQANLIFWSVILLTQRWHGNYCGSQSFSLCGCSY